MNVVDLFRSQKYNTLENSTYCWNFNSNCHEIPRIAQKSLNGIHIRKSLVFHFLEGRSKRWLQTWHLKMYTFNTEYVFGCHAMRNFQLFMCLSCCCACIFSTYMWFLFWWYRHFYLLKAVLRHEVISIQTGLTPTSLSILFRFFFLLIFRYTPVFKKADDRQMWWAVRFEAL